VQLDGKKWRDIANGIALEQRKEYLYLAGCFDLYDQLQTCYGTTKDHPACKKKGQLEIYEGYYDRITE
jgi:hypothetical protein